MKRSNDTLQLIQYYLNMYAQINIQFDDNGHLASVSLFQNGKWIASPAATAKIRLQAAMFPVQHKASIIFKR